jgi:uncharacterized protein YbjT (DUF2867 family)
MKVAVIGASGGVGRATVKSLLARSDRVVALSRHPESLGPATEQLKLVAADARDPVLLAKSLAGCDAVVLALGVGGTLMKPNTPLQICSQATRTLLPVMRGVGVKRLVLISSFGVGDTRDLVPFTTKLFFRFGLGPRMQDKEAQEAEVKASSTEWTIVQPVRLTDEPPTHKYQASAEGKVRKGTIPREDVAQFAVAQLGSTEYLRRTVTLSG